LGPSTGNPFIGIVLRALGIGTLLAVMLISFWVFWRNVKRRVPMKEYSKPFHRKNLKRGKLCFKHYLAFFPGSSSGFSQAWTTGPQPSWARWVRPLPLSPGDA
jgi:hypothetical protein